MKKLVFSIVAQLILVSSVYCQIIDYNWPSTAPKSPNYEVKVSQGGVTKNLFVYYSVPNLNVDPLYPGEGNGVTGTFQDRSMSFVEFAFTNEITIEVTKKFGVASSRVEISPKAFGVNPFYFDGTTVKFKIQQRTDGVPCYVSVNFIGTDNQDDDNTGGANIRNDLMIFADKPEENIPKIGNTGIVAYSDTANISDASIIVFQAGQEYDLKNRFNKIKGQLGQMPIKPTQRVYIEGGAIVNGSFRGDGNPGIWIYGRGIISGRKFAWHWFRDSNGDKDAFINMMGANDAHFEGVVIENPTHHTIPSGNNTVIKNIKIIGWASNHDGIRPASGSIADGIFIKTSDDYDYARDPHVVKNSIFWPPANGAIGQLGWNSLGTGYAQYINNFLINSEWSQLWNSKGNTGMISGSKADGGIKLQNNVVQDLKIEDRTNYLVNSAIEKDGSEGYFKNFTFKNITTEYPFQCPNGTATKQIMKGRNLNWIEGWTFTNLLVDGVLVTWDNYKNYFDLNLTGSNGTNTDNTNYVRNVTFNSEGSFNKITITSNVDYSTGAFYPKGESGVVTCMAGKDQVISILPKKGYKITNVKVDGVSKGRIQNVLFNNVSADHSLDITVDQGDDYFDNTITAIANESIEPKFELENNYPNPFNPSTTIKYSVPQLARVSITIYNAIGEKVKTLVDETKSAGSYSVVWNGRNEANNLVASGVYYCQLSSSGSKNNSYITRKLTLVK